MNDDTDKPLNTVGDDALEARITAWVLGEASSFEAGELEKLCAADPALGLFERRLRVLHGLVAEDFKAGPAVQWKLAAERRTKITDLLGVEPEVAERIEKTSRHFGRRALLALAACVVLTLVSISLIGGVGESAKPAGVKSSASVAIDPAKVREYREKALAELERAVVQQKDVVEDKRKLLAQIIRQEGIVYNDREAGARGFEPSGDAAEEAARHYDVLDREKVQLESQIEGLLKHDGEDLLAYASGLDIPGNAIPEKLPELQEAKREYDALKGSGLPQDHPELVAKSRELQVAEAEVGQEVAALRETLKTKLELTKEQTSRLKTRMESTIEDAIGKGIANQTFVDAKNDFESSQRLLETLQIKEISEKMQMAATEDALVLNDEAPGSPAPTPAPAALPAKPAANPSAELASNTAIDGNPGFRSAGKSLALAKEKAAKGGASAVPEQQLAARSEPEAIAGPPPAPATPAPAPAAEPDALAANQRGTATRAKEEANGRGFVGGGMAGGGGAAGGPSGETAPAIATRTNTDFIATLDGVTIPGIPADPGTNVTDIVTAGNRSGDGAITRNNIDAVLNDPARHSKAEAKGDGIAALTGTFGDEATAMIGKSVEEMQEGAKTWLEPDVAGGPEVEYKTRNPKPGEPVNGAFGGGLDSLAEADGEPLEPATKSRFSMNLRGGTDRAAEQDEATAFGNGDDMGRLSRDRQQAPELRLGENLGFYDSTGAVANGVAGLTDLAKKQNEAEPAEVVAGRWFGTTADESTKGLKDANAPGGAPADPFFDTTLLSETQLGGLKRDLNDDFAPALGDAEGEVRAKLLEQVDKAWALPVPTGDADEFDGFVNQGTPIADGSADGPVPITPAPAVTDPAAMDEVRRKLYTAEGGYNLGKYDDAHRAYEEVLRLDPYNKAARRGMEQVATARADYYRAAYDQTRAQLLADVDQAWELSVPPVVTGPQPAIGKALMRDKRKSIIIPEIKFVDSTVDEALDFLRVKAVELDAELDPAKKGVNVVLAMPPADSGLANPATLKIKSLQMKNATLDDVIDEIARATGLEVEVGADAVTFRTGPETISKADQIVDLMSETLAAAEPFSTFSLHVSDASFKLAQAAMERGEVPAAEGIRPEEFYNAFDYGDPAPASGEPVVCVTEQSAHPAFAQRNLLRIGVRTGSQGRGASTPLNLTLLLDHSGSMEREDRNAGLAMAVRQLSGLLKEGDTITVAGFSRQPRLLADRLPGARAQELNELIARTPSEGGTNLEEGLKLGEELAKRQFNPAAQNRVVLFTDGAANLGDARPEALQARIEGLRQQGIAFDAAGFGADGLNDKLLERLTRNGNGRYYIVDGPEDADAGFAKQLAGAFRPAAENVKVQVRFNPARVAKYKLIGFEEHRLKKEDFRNDAVDAAEMAAEEAGNALYQIETLPQGEGEVGEVSVRFRDVASGQMVERTWTIPYDAQAPAFDRATPSIQLAGLAAFTAEKLRAAPMADAVDFQQLGQVYAGVRARYPNSQPVADLGSMIGKMK